MRLGPLNAWGPCALYNLHNLLLRHWFENLKLQRDIAVLRSASTTFAETSLHGNFGKSLRNGI